MLKIKDPTVIEIRYIRQRTKILLERCYI